MNNEDPPPVASNNNTPAAIATTTTTRPPCPLTDASCFQRLFFGWAWPLLKLGSSRPLEESDLPHVHKYDSSAYNKSYIQQLLVWNDNHDNLHEGIKHDGRISKGNSNSAPASTSTPLLGRALIKDYYKTTRFAQCLLVLNSASKIGQAIALGLLMEQFTIVPIPTNSEDDAADADALFEANTTSSSSSRTKEGYIWCIVLIACGLVTFPTKQRLYFELYRKGMQIRVGLVATLYDKALRLCSTSSSSGSSHNGGSSSSSAGKLTNLASNDVERFVLASIPSLYLAVGPVEAVVILVIGVNILGPVFAVGHALFLLLVPLQFYLGRRFVKFRRQVASITDARATLISQAVSGVRIMKMNAWELEFEKRIAALRAKEVATLTAASRFKAVNEAIYYFSSTVVAAIVFAVNVGLGNELTPRSVYTTLSLLNILHLSLSKQIPNAIMHLSECHVSSERIQAFLDLAESSKVIIHNNDELSSSRPLISFTNVTCVWDKTQLDDHCVNSAKSEGIELETSNIALSDITLSFERGQLYCLTGKVGAGKSALIQALTGELHVKSGGITRCYSSLAYASQVSWIMNGTIRDNILMGLAFRHDWYSEVVDACGLRFDLSTFVQGDQTVVGDRGVQCSGGQQARIGLARAFYRDPQVLLLDDPLSAVDSTVSRSTYQEAIQKLGVQRGKCVILATHQHQFLGSGDHCILLEKGKISSIELIESSTANGSDTKEANEEKKIETDDIVNNHTNNEEESNIDIGTNHEEAKNTGIIEWSTWSSYRKAAGGFRVFIFFFVVFVVTQSILLVMIVEVGQWAEAPFESQDSAYWFGLVLGLALCLVVMSILRAQMSYHVLIEASKVLHNSMLDAVLRSKVVFFDMNPLGRILNRFSADVGICDETLPLTIYDFLVGAFIVCGGVVTASVVLPFVLIAIPPLIWCFVKLRRIFVVSTRELKRLEGMARSPIFALMSESLHGAPILRANSCIEHCKDKFEKMHDAHTRACFSFVASSRWFATQMDILAFILMSFASILAVLFNDQGWFRVDPAVLGLALTLLIQIAGTNFPWIVRQSAEVVNQMTSVERIQEFAELPSEAPFDLDNDKQLAGSWPDKGAIEVKALGIRYRPELPLALDDATFSIPAGSRIGIVGRTGSGKSTLVQAFFRLLEAENGSIYIDGIDISSLGLHMLRGQISVIPQVPTLFSGCTLRDNLDLFRVHSDREIKTSLDEVHCLDFISELPKGIHTMISEMGSNFSVGQRQLLCLARANLKKNKILVLDEATANVDKHTDKLLHDSLNSAYQDATIIKIAHRLDTVIEDDYILVLGSGKVVEFGTPAELLTKKEGCGGGAFYKMVHDTKMAGELTARALAKQKQS